MSLATTGIEVHARSRWLRDTVELVSSMRFAISLLTVICIAATIGTVVKQNEPAGNYVNQFGPFWADVYRALGLTGVYSAWWFLLILTFLVVSTSLCIARNTPKILHDLRHYKEHLREQGLQAFHLKGQGTTAESREAAFERVSSLLVRAGWKAKVQVREHGTMIAARRGAANKLGYIAAHSAIVLVCVGGLLDGDLIVRAQMALQGKTAFSGDGFIRDIPAAHRLGPATPTFRANLRVPEQGRSGVAVIGMQDGFVLQELPFDVELKKFIVDYYATGMPKLFASEILIHDRETGQTITATVKVNEPAFHRGVAIYQSGFEDGGSALKLRAIPMGAGGEPFDLQGVVGTSTTLTNASTGGRDTLTLEFTNLRVINVENFSAPGGGASTDVRKVDLVGSLQQHLGSGAKVRTKKELRNVGPSVSYKLRDAAGQAREFNNYMLPVEIDGQKVFLAGVRDTPAENFRYLRIPADEQGSLAGWSRLREALGNPALRDKAAERYVRAATPADKPQMAPQLKATASRVLALFAAAESVKPGQKPPGGLQAISDFLEASVPEGERARISDVLLRILNGSLFELMNLARESAAQSPLEPSETTQAFMTQAVLALSESYFYPAPVLLELTDFTQKQASVFQVARAPGKTLVYLGAVLLIVGVFAMLYIRERRLWVWISPEADGAAHITTALSSTRRTMDADAEFEWLKQAILGQPAHPAVRLDISHRERGPSEAS
ncbi:cytochrome c biogenesis protein ResB [Piscinibacter sp. XHJ-5]|uniref:cytochrome c biogenesis protein ResB n=1 Tax=Piscinibacter sp. XHJ-5 TaxID=3037797 RepID=UPI0024530709|nr:cytochrome c biogenesis protein ResB [Piscinibacter sp. XHJ-5]